MRTPSFALLTLATIFLGHSTIFPESIAQVLRLPEQCLRAVEDESIFNNFKQNPKIKGCIENVTQKQGAEYLEYIKKNHLECLGNWKKYCENDSIGNPTVYQYSNMGYCSPTTLRYIKIAAELKALFGNKINKMHIIEIGGGYGGQCKVLSDMCGFASYTIVDHAECNALTEKYLNKLNISGVNFVNAGQLNKLSSYDLVISNYSYSQMSTDTQDEYLENVVRDTPFGYFTLDNINHYHNISSHSNNHILSILYSSNRKGSLKSGVPITGDNSMLLTWTPVEEKRPSKVGDIKHLEPIEHNKKQRAVTYEFSGGRLGDNLLAYIHAKWISMKYEIPLLYKPFKYSDSFNLSDQDQKMFKKNPFKRTLKVNNENQIKHAKGSVLIEIPYFPDCKFEYDSLNMQKEHRPFFYVDWNDPKFREEVIKCLSAKKGINTLSLPDDHLTIALHVRRGGAYEPYKLCEKNYPLKFPPDEYFIDQIKQITEIFPDKPIYVYLFTDDLNPGQIAKKYALEVNHPNIIFDWYDPVNSQYQSNILSDFFSIPKFDCLIRSTSNFSAMASKLGNFAIEVTPTHGYFKKGKLIIDQTETTFIPKINRL